ncbi:hypothetical protein V6Z12_D02G165100 [Gossypium hirsutum]
MAISTKGGQKLELMIGDIGIEFHRRIKEETTNLVGCVLCLLACGYPMQPNQRLWIRCAKW